MDRDRLMLIGAFLIFTAIFFFYYPATRAIVDESAYLSGAYALQRGTVFYDRAGINQEHMSDWIRGHQISRYPPGNSLLLVPFTVIGRRAIFVRGWLLAAAAFLLMILLLRHYRLPGTFAILLLYHPTVLLYSRTAMSDLPALVMVLAGMYAWIRKKHFWSGLIFGLSGAVRYPNLIVPLSVAAVALARKEFRPALALAAGSIAGLLPLAAYNLLGFGTAWGSLTGYGTAFAVQNLPVTLMRFILALLVIYPGMLIAAAFWPSPDRWTWWMPALAMLLFYSFQGYFDSTGSRAADLVMSLRYLLPALPLILLPAAGAVSRWSRSNRWLVPAALGLIAIAVLVCRRHQNFLQEKRRYEDRFYVAAADAEFVLVNKDVGEMIDPYRRHIPWAYFERMRKPQPLERYRRLDRLYLACLTRDPDIMGIYVRAAAGFSATAEIVADPAPDFFSVRRVELP